MAKIFPVDFEEKLTMAQDDYILFSDSEDGNKIKKAQYSNLKGDKWDKGDTGATGATGATWPQWPDWPTWPQWPAGTITVGTVTTWAAGTNVAITNTGTSSAAVLNFTIPQGIQGETWANWADGADGADWEAATITVGTTTTLSPWSSATVTNVGTSSAAILNFWIPKGESGSWSGDVSWPASSTDWHLAVFDWATGKLIKDWGSVPTSFAPDSAGSEWQVLTKWASGYDWATVSGWDVQVSTDTGNLLSTGVKLWLWDKADFDNLWTLDTNTIYAPIEWISGWLPSTYQEVEWIKSSWTQYINTGYIPTIYDEVETKFSTETTNWDTNLYWSRYMQNGYSNKQDFTIWINTASWKWIAVHYPKTQTTDCTDTWWIFTSDIINTARELKITPQNDYVDGTNLYTFNVSRTPYAWVDETYLFAQNEYDWEWLKNRGKFTLYYFKISANWTPIRDFVPCYRIADGVIWLYDLIWGQFYTNSWTGTFTKWPDVN